VQIESRDHRKVVGRRSRAGEARTWPRSRLRADGRTVTAMADGRTFGVLHPVRGGSTPSATRSAPAPAVRKAGASAFGLRLKRGRPWAVKRRECGEPGSTSKQSGNKGAERFRSSPVAGTLNTDERALGHTSSGHSVAHGDRLHLVASAAHGGSATVVRGAHARTPLGLGPG
jgi:hypothetical protein